jgi:hypothetical protein
MRERSHNLHVKVDDAELAQLHALADDADEPIARTVRRWIRERYVARFGDATPRKPNLKARVERMKAHD